MKKLLLILTISWVSCFADQAALNNFLTNAKTIKANFTQTITTGKKSRTTVGTMEIERPNKFRWEYTQDKQLIVSDAKKIYIYDQPLQQVTINSLNSSISKSPAAILAGANDIKKLYRISDVNSHVEGLSWIKIEPRKVSDNNGFQEVLMGFDQSQQLTAMKFTDTFGNKTILKFSNLQVGIKLPSSDFEFKVPANVDVVEK